MAPMTANLTSTSAGCTSSLVATTCTLTLALGPGHYTMTATTYSGVLDGGGNPTGSTLSTNQNVPDFEIKAGQANTISVSLGGIPHAIVVLPAGGEKHAMGDQDRGFALIGTVPVSFQVFATDAAGNIIIGPGAPVFAVGSNAASVGVSTTPSASTPNTFALLAPAFSRTQSTITITIANAATYGLTCGTGGVVCSKTVTADAGAIVVQGYNGTGIYSASGIGPFFSALNTQTFALDSANDLFVAANQQISKYAPPFSSVPALTLNASAYVYTLRFDGSDNLYTAQNVSGGCSVTRYNPSLSVVSTTFCFSNEYLQNEGSFAVTSDGKAFGLSTEVYQGSGNNYTLISRTWTSSNNGVSYLAVGGAGYTENNSGTGPITVGPAGELVFANSLYSNSINNYQSLFLIATSPYTSLVSHGVPNGYIYAIAEDSAGNVVVAHGSQDLLLYPPPYTSASALPNTVGAGALTWAPGIGMFVGHFNISLGLRSSDYSTEATVLSGTVLNNSYVNRVSVIP